MRTYKITIEYVGLTGPYKNVLELQAKDEKSAEKKARKIFGNRDGTILEIVQAATIINTKTR